MVICMLGMHCGVIVGGVNVVFDAKRPKFILVSVFIDIRDIGKRAALCYTSEESYSCFSG